MSENGTTKENSKNSEYCEEKNLEKLNTLLKKAGADFTYSQDDLNYIRYYFTASGNEMTPSEYCAHVWNKGSEGTGAQLDRMIDSKLVTKFPQNEDFKEYEVGENQFAYSTEILAQMYANQAC